MTEEDMAKVLAAVTLCGDHVEASPVMARLAREFPDHFDKIDAAYDEHYGYETDDGRWTLSSYIEAYPIKARPGSQASQDTIAAGAMINLEWEGFESGLLEAVRAFTLSDAIERWKSEVFAVPRGEMVSLIPWMIAQGYLKSIEET